MLGRPAVVSADGGTSPPTIGSAEYAHVAAYFTQRLSPAEATRVHLVAIERIQTEAARESYDLILNQMKRREDRRRAFGKAALDTSEVELAWVFHACAADAVDNIIIGGFNRSFAGKNATRYGPGSYFARESSYAARATYSPPDAHGVKRMFMCRLALGAHTPVKPGYSGKEPPVRDSQTVAGVGSLKYDTTTNDKLNDLGLPEIFVAYRDGQALAEYHVSFKLA